MYAVVLPFCYLTAGEPRKAAMIAAQKLADEKWANEAFAVPNVTLSSNGTVTGMDDTGMTAVEVDVSMTGDTLATTPTTTSSTSAVAALAVAAEAEKLKREKENKVKDSLDRLKVSRPTPTPCPILSYSTTLPNADCTPICTCLYIANSPYVMSIHLKPIYVSTFYRILCTAL